MADTFKVVKTKFKPPKLMLVRWLDATTDSDWKEAEDPSVELMTCWTVGWFKEETDEKLVLAQTITSDGGSGHDWGVPVFTIKKRRIIKIVLP